MPNSGAQKRPLIINPFSGKNDGPIAPERKVQIIRLSACIPQKAQSTPCSENQTSTSTQSNSSNNFIDLDNGLQHMFSSEVECSDSESESGSCKRKFLRKWISIYPFIEYDGKKSLMYCKICHKYADEHQKGIRFVSGTNNFRASSIQYHEQSAFHAKCQKLADAASGDDIIDHSILDTDREKLVHILKSVYFIIKTKSPYTYFPHLCETQKKQGIDVGSAYTSHNKVVPYFAKYIALSLEKDLSEKLNKLDLFSLILDNSFGRAVESHELVYIKYFVNDEVKTIFLGVIDSKAKSYEFIYESLSNLFEKFGIANWVENVVYIMVDTSTNFRLWHDGLIHLIQESASKNFICEVRYLPHKIKRCCCVFQNHSLANQFSGLIWDIFWYYDKLSEDKRKLCHIGKELDNIVDSFGSIPKNRFVTFCYDTLDAVSKDWMSLVYLLRTEQNAVNLDSKIRKAGSRILSGITRSSFICRLAVLLDIFSCLNTFSENLLKEDTLPYAVYEELQLACTNVEKAANGLGSVAQQFMQEMLLIPSVFRDVRIRIDTNMIQIVDEMKDLGKALIFHLKSVVNNLSFLENSFILNTNLWPQNENLAEYGNVEFISIFMKCGGIEENIDSALSEWCSIKEKVSSYFPSELRENPKSAILKVISDFSQTFPLATTVLKQILLLSFSSLEMERGYHEMSLIKSSERSTLSVQSLQNSMIIAMYGPSIALFNPVPALEFWLRQCNRRYRKRTKQKKKNIKYCSEKVCSSYVNPNNLDVL